MAGNFSLNANYKFAAIVVVVILLVATAALSSMQIFRQVEAIARAQSASQTHLLHAEAFLGDLVEAESAQRGFLLTGNARYLERYLPIRDSIHSQLVELIPQASTPAAQQHLSAVLPLLDAKLAHMARSIDLRRAKDADAIIHEIGKGSDKELMDSIRTEMSAYFQFERALLAQHDKKLASGMRDLFTMIVTASVIALLLAFFFAYLMYRESQNHIKEVLQAETQRLLAVQEDVNKQLQLTNAHLHISEEWLAVTLDSIDDAVITTDAEGRVTLLNPLAERLTGWTRLESAMHPVEEVFHIINADTRKRHPVPIRETLAHGTTLGLANHTIVIARDGTECDIADSCAPIRTREGKIVGAVLVFRDVTERKKQDMAMHAKNAELERATAIAEKANQAKSEFLSSMSHELRTPLSAILGFAQLIDSSTPGPTPSQKRSLDQILKAGWYLLELINEILDLALIESGKLSISMEPLSLTSVMQECHAMIEPQAQKRGIGLDFPAFDDACRVYVKADRTRVKQVLINLLSNAVKYNAAGGKVTVHCTPHGAGRIRVSIKDEGTGMSAEQLQQLFQPFNRLGQETTASEGTGIGLVMAKRLTELMGGAIGVDSIIGQGSVFWIELNLTAEPKSGDTSALDPALMPPQVNRTAPLRTLLYVEDNAANLMLVEDIIERQPDIRLLIAPDALSGIKLARTALPDVVLMDINLPGINDIQAMRILAEDPATAGIPVVALSANAIPRDIEKGLEAGFFRYLTKPIKVDELLETLEIAFKFAQTQPAKPGANKKDVT